MSAKTLEDDTCSIETAYPSTRHGFKNHHCIWLKVVDVTAAKHKATKFAKTLTLLMVCIKKVKQMKKVKITFPKEASNKHFSPGLPDGSLQRVSLPWVFKHESVSKKTNKSTKFKSSEALVVWHPFIVDSNGPLEDLPKPGSDDNVDDVNETLGDWKIQFDVDWLRFIMN